MSTLQTQYKNYLKDNNKTSDELSYNDWVTNVFLPKFTGLETMFIDIETEHLTLKPDGKNRYLVYFKQNMKCIGDAHIYLNQIDGVKEQLGRELTFEERRDLMVKYTQDNNLLPIPFTLPFGVESKNKYLEVCDKYNIPKRTREPYPLPTLKHMKSDEFYKSLGEDLSLLSHLTVDDFVLENYKSHPKIYFPLSN